MTPERLQQIEFDLAGAITRECEAPMAMRHTVRCAAAVPELIAEVRRLWTAMEQQAPIFAIPDALTCEDDHEETLS